MRNGSRHPMVAIAGQDSPAARNTVGSRSEIEPTEPTASPMSGPPESNHSQIYITPATTLGVSIPIISLRSRSINRSPGTEETSRDSALTAMSSTALTRAGNALARSAPGRRPGVTTHSTARRFSPSAAPLASTSLTRLGRVRSAAPSLPLNAPPPATARAEIASTLASARIAIGDSGDRLLLEASPAAVGLFSFLEASP